MAEHGTRVRTHAELVPKSREPFPVALQEIMDRKGRSGRWLAAESELSQTTVVNLLRGDLAPTIPTMERLANALKIDPNYFAEYRLEVERERLNWRTRGLNSALAALGE